MMISFTSARRLLPTLARCRRRQRAKATQPAGDQGALEVALPLVLRDRLAPVEADPAVDVRPRPLDEGFGLLGAGPQGEDLLDDQRLAHLVDLQGGEVVLELARLGIEMYADEVQRPAD